MRIGVVCAAEQRLEFFRDILPGHRLIRVSAEDASSHGNLTELDWIFIDMPALAESPSLSQALRPLASMLGSDEENCACLVRHDENGKLQLQCGRQIAAKGRAANGLPPRGTSTLIFQLANSAMDKNHPIQAVPDTACQG